MKFPTLVWNAFATKPIHVVIYGEGLTEDGAPIIAAEGDFSCNWQDSASTVLTKQQKKVRIAGKAYIVGDIAPNVADISGGYVEVNGGRYQIAKGVKARNPDGTVNFTELDVM